MPTTRLNKSTIDAIPYLDKGQMVVWDSDLKGFGLVINQRSKTFIVQRDVNRKTQRVTLGRYGVLTPDTARKEANKRLYMLMQGINLKQQEKQQATKDMTLAKLMNDFFEARNRLKPRTRKDYRYYIEHYLPDWLEKPVASITEDMVMKRYARIGEKNGKTVANNIRRIMSTMLNYGIAAHKIMDRNPVKIIASTKSSFPQHRRRTYIKSHQLAAFWKALHEEENDTCRDYLLLILFTGMRRTEAATLRWENVDLQARTLTLPDTKNGEPLTLPLSEYLLSLLNWRYEMYGDSPWVFPGHGRSGHLEEPKKAVYRITKATGIKFTLHDLRRTFITIAESLDISAYALKRLINHKITNDITGGYIIVDVERLREPVERVANAILKSGQAHDDKQWTRACLTGANS